MALAPNRIGILAFCLVGALICRGHARGGASELARQGRALLSESKLDSARALFLRACDSGMSVDSLYFFLSETALASTAYDTAMVFNLAIRTPRPGPFRDSVWTQRYRLYVLAGLTDAAKSLADSMPSLRSASAGRRERPALSWRLSGGYENEDHYDAFGYPFDGDLGGFPVRGWLLKNQGEILFPLPSPASAPMHAGLGYEADKSYYNDSVDYRVGARFKVNPLRDSLALSAGAEIGRVTGAGRIFSWKAECSYLAMGRGGFTFWDGGYEAEYTASGTRRYDIAWVSLYRDGTLKTGRGFSFSLSLSAMRLDPLAETDAIPVLYVDDVSKPQPTHYTDASFSDSIKYNKINAYAKLTSNPGSYDANTVSPQTSLTAAPFASYEIPFPHRWSLGINCGYSLSVFPDDYAWASATLPTPGNAGVTGGSEFQGLALSRSDGRLHAAILQTENGGAVGEYYSAAPLEERSRMRLDQRAQAGMSLRKSVPGWGVFALEGFLGRTWSTLDAEAATWIPRDEIGATAKWNGSWGG